MQRMGMVRSLLNGLIWGGTAIFLRSADVAWWMVIMVIVVTGFGSMVLGIWMATADDS